MYMPGRLRTASNPLRTFMDSAPYSAAARASSVSPARPCSCPRLIGVPAANVTRMPQDLVARGGSCEWDHQAQQKQQETRAEVQPMERAGAAEHPARAVEEYSQREAPCHRHQRRNRENRRDIGG